MREIASPPAGARNDNLIVMASDSDAISLTSLAAICPL
jgi:hypothetical protein